MAPGMVGLVAVATLALNAASFVEMLGAALQGLERMDAEAVIRGGHKAAQFLLPVAAWLLARRAGWVLAAQAAASAAALAVAYGWVRARGFVPPARRSPGGFRRTIVPWLAEVWPLTAVAVCITLAARVDLIFLSRFRQMAETGLYGAASRLFELTQVFPALLTGVLFPVLSRLAVGDERARRDRTYERLFRWFAALAVPSAILLHVWAGAIVRVCYGDAYGDSAAILRLLAPAMGFSFIGYLFVNALIASDRQRAFLGVTVVGCVVNIAANLLLVPAYGAAGAAWARVLTEAVFFAGGLAVFHRIIHRVPVGLLTRVLLASAVSIGAAWATGGSPVWGTLAALAYLPLLWLLRVIAADDFAFGLRLLRSRR
jgi:O-antigen/teichoic acid export membrane protein